MRIGITGANGFIGSTLVRRLVDEGHRLRCLVHRGTERLRGLDVEQVMGSVHDPVALARLFSRVELVYHLAGRATDWGERDLFFRVNAHGTRAVTQAAAAAGVARLVFTSSLAVHRFTGHVDADERTPADQWGYAYGASKATAERILLDAHRAGLIEAVLVRPGVVVFGPQDTTAFVHLAPMFARGRWTHVAGGRPLLCYAYVDNLVDGLVLAGTVPEAAGGVFNITDDLRLSWRELVSAVISAFGVRERSLSVPVPVARAAGIALEAAFRAAGAKSPPPITDYRTALVSRDFHFSCARARRVLGYAPRVPFDIGLRRTVAWWREREERS